MTITIPDWAWAEEAVVDQSDLLLIGFLATNTSPEGFVGFNMTAASASLRYLSPLMLKGALERFQSAGIIEDLAFGPSSCGMKMCRPEGKWSAEKTEEKVMFSEMEGTIWQSIVDYWNEKARLRPARLTPTAKGTATAKQIEAMKRAWRNADFVKQWKRSIRVLLVSSYHQGKRIDFNTWIGRARNSNNLWSMTSLVIFNEQNPSLPEADHLVLFPPLPGYEEEEWKTYYPNQREALYANYIKTAKAAV